MLALDANVLTYFIDVINAAPQEPTGRLAEEKVALVRIFLWMPTAACFKLVPTVKGEYENIRDKPKLDSHDSWVMTHISQVRPLPNEAAVISRSDELKLYHAGENDRKIVAECELTSIGALLSCDAKFVARLRMETGVWLVRPSEFWDKMRIPKGCPPNRAPAYDNPLLQCDWWHW